MSDITALSRADILLIRKALYLYADIAGEQAEDQTRCLELADTFSLIQSSYVEQDPSVLTISKYDLVDSEIITQQEADSINQEDLEKVTSRISQEACSDLLDNISEILEELGYKGLTKS